MAQRSVPVKKSHRAKAHVRHIDVPEPDANVTVEANHHTADPFPTKPLPDSALGLSTDVPDVLPVTPGVWYRLHWTKRPWETGEDAISVPGVAEDHDARRKRYEDDQFFEEAKGYSCLSDPRALYAYLHSTRWLNLDGFPGEHRVVMFSGEQVGNGVDGEPTVAPDEDTSGAVEMSWEDFESRVLNRDIEMDLFHGPELDPEGEGVSTYGMDWINSPQQEEMILMSHRLGIASDPWWEEPEDDEML